VLRLPADAPAAYRALVAGLSEVPTARVGEGEKVPAYALSVANAIFSQKGWAFEDAFRRTVAADFAAGFEELDFKAAAAARDRINAWVAEKTKDRIKDIVPAGMPTPDTRMVLANAIHFKAAWREAFREGATADGPFEAAAGKSVTARFMKATESLAYAETDEAQVVEIPYLAGATSMVVVLPRKRDGLKALVAGLSGEAIDRWVAALARRKVALEFPKFTFTTFLDLTRTLPDLGMKDAFDAAKADFSGICAGEPLFIGAVLHKAFVAVDEKGTEAAAATIVGMRAGAAPRPVEPTPFKADHPFLFLVRHAATGEILFLGQVGDPTAN
jgi:serpin B